MSDQSAITVTINFNDPEVDLEEQNEKVQSLLSQLKKLDEVKRVGRVSETKLPEDSKALGIGWVAGLLTAEVNVENFKKIMLFLGERLSSKTIELEIEFNGSKLKVKTGSKAGLDAAIAASQTFIDTLKTKKNETQD
jgi:hypothetical protein